MAEVMPNHAPSHAHVADDATVTSAGRAPGKATLTQRMVTRAGPPAAPARPARDPVAAAVQRQQIAHDLAAACGFFGGPAASIDASLAQLPVQASGDRHTGLDDATIAARAAYGVSGSGGALPHLDAIQRAFGPAHDLTGVRAHVGGAAADAATAIGAHAYATGNDVAFASAPDLFLAAHEATHVVQQRQGVSLKGAVGQAGDRYEQHADEVAAAVVRGDSVGELLGGGGGGHGGAAKVQRWDRKMTSNSGAETTISSDPSTVATIDGRVTGKPSFHETNPYLETYRAEMNLPTGFDGVASIDFFADTDVDEGWTDWSDTGTLVINAVADVVNPGGGPIDIRPRDKKPIVNISDRLPVLATATYEQVKAGGHDALKLHVTLIDNNVKKIKEESGTLGANISGKVSARGVDVEVGKDSLYGDLGRTKSKYTQDNASRVEFAYLLVLCPPASAPTPTPTPTPTPMPPPGPTPAPGPASAAKRTPFAPLPMGTARMFFEWGTADPVRHGGREVNDLAARLDTSADFRVNLDQFVINVEGYADPVGEEIDNTDLSSNRATRAAELFAARFGDQANAALPIRKKAFGEYVPPDKTSAAPPTTGKDLARCVALVSVAYADNLAATAEKQGQETHDEAQAAPTRNGAGAVTPRD
ncbi:MAG: DUF4157 domain-containing protein [Kofleriaceae bacterium]